MIIRALGACRATLTPCVSVLSAAMILGVSVLATAAILPLSRVAPPVAAAPVAAPPIVAAPRRPESRASRSGRTALAARPVTVLKTVPVGRTFAGSASWYGAELHGNRTANGERFDMHELTAASRTLPFGTRLNVCLTRDPGRCVIVRINDRGPYVGDRVLDLSAAARRALGFGGVARVTATPVERRRVPVLAKPRVTEPARPPARALVGAAIAAVPAPVRSVERPGDTRFGQVTVAVAVLALLLLLGCCWGSAPRLRLPSLKEFPWSSRSSARRLA